MDFYYWGIVNLLSPPYGDCTEWNATVTCIEGVSPPYGDCTKKAFYED